MKIKELETAVGGLSTPSKMPGFSYGIPAKSCIVGSILQKKEGTVCSNCYALKGMYVFPCVQKAQYNRLRLLQKDINAWKEAMIDLLPLKYRNRTGEARVFRWHDSGDLQSLEHLKAIVHIAQVVSDIRFWLPTRENWIVAEYLRENPKGFPRNLNVRLSVPMIGQKGFARKTRGVTYSSVSSNSGFACPARGQGNECKSCRACWDKKVKLVDYSLH